MEHLEEDSYLEQLDAFLSRPNQVWLLGAGASLDAGLPLMGPLTNFVLERLEGSDSEPLISAIWKDLLESAHIEHLLSHLGDYYALAERAKSKTVTIDGETYDLESMMKAHAEVLNHITHAIHWGYKYDRETETGEVGNPLNSIVDIEPHRKFVRALLGTRRSGMENRRPPVRFFTTNYDTLLEDSLALERHTCWDGFSGGAIAYRSHRYGADEPGFSQRYDAHVMKLHGSIDWHLDDDGNLIRVRLGDKYPGNAKRVMIYPQATKYVATQRDPFSAQFDLLRRSLSNNGGNVLAICGYSFGDEHINHEIELSMESPGNDTTILAFVMETDRGLPEALDIWLKERWGKRVFVMTQKGLYNGKIGPICQPEEGSERSWWTFAGVTNLLENGPGGAAK
ncbi:SIR2 family protein [Franzmannia pantelleriensis]|nr:SIR2 family protein [Halomonas pantelleriensis]